MSVESAGADSAARLDEYERAGQNYAHIDGLRGAVLAEIATLQGELVYWDRVADAAWRRLMISDDRLMDARDRLRAELRRASAAQAITVEREAGVPAAVR